MKVSANQLAHTKSVRSMDVYESSGQGLGTLGIMQCLLYTKNISRLLAIVYFYHDL